ncbi:hypothetical protein ACS0TY_027232 [Phlomoides rotata]
MKALSKPLSSPSRADKFPPPLMRFLRSNVGSRSRGRSRSSPIFYLRSRKSNPTVIESIQEPSSPKVTCIGQVRVRRSGKSKVRKTGAAAVKRRRCWWLRKGLLCGRISARLMKPLGRAFCRFGYCKKIDATEDSFRVYSNREGEKRENVVGGDDSRSRYENFGDGSRERGRDILESSSSSVPKNALILTRCRSAPYRSSSLGGIFWASSFSGKEEDEQASENGVKSEPLQIPITANDKDEGEETGKRRISEEISSKKMANSVHPLLLTRCKSEPARTGERLNVEAIFSREIRLDDVQQQNS